MTPDAEQRVNLGAPSTDRPMQWYDLAKLGTPNAELLARIKMSLTEDRFPYFNRRDHQGRVIQMWSQDDVMRLLDEYAKDVE